MSSQSLTITFAHRNPNNFRRFRFETEYASSATTSSDSSSSSSTATPFAIVRIFEEPKVIETIDLTNDDEDLNQDQDQDQDLNQDQDLDQDLDEASSEFSEEDPFDFNNPEPQKDSEVVVINGDSLHNDTDTQHAPVQEEDMDFEEEDIEIREERIDIQEEDFDMDEEEALLEQGIRERANESEIEREREIERQRERQREREALLQDLRVTQPRRRSGRTLRIFQRFIDDPIFMQRMRNNRCQNVHYVTCKKYSSKGLTIPMSERCGICIRPVPRGDAFVTSCKHLYCSQCFDLWNKQCFNHSARKLMTCPMCRSTTFTVTKFVAKKSK